MTCNLCNKENVVIVYHEGTGSPILFDKQSERPHVCPIKSVYCPIHRMRFPQNRVCEHYEKLNYVPGENEDFFIRNILNPPRPKQTFKRIGTSAGNTRTKNSICKHCNQSIDGLSAAKQEEHVSKCKGQLKLGS